MDGSQFDALHRRLATGRRSMVGGALAMLGVVFAPSFAAGDGNHKGNGHRKRKDRSNSETCCPSGQVPFGGGCCARDNICTDNQGQQVCCPHRCFTPGGLCCPCDTVFPCQQCVVSGNQAGCQQYCNAGQFCMPGGCVTFP